jgi:hypothetical protein
MGRLANPEMDSMKKYAGCLKGSKVFDGDPVTVVPLNDAVEEKAIEFRRLTKHPTLLLPPHPLY